MIITEEQNVNPQEITQKDLILIRVEFYKKLSTILSQDATGIYIAPGIDPIPYDNLKQKVVYFAHPSDGNENKQTLTSNPESSSGIYKDYITNHGHFSNLQFDLGDIEKTDYPSSSFNFLILRNPPIFITEQKYIDEIDRILSSEGTIILDSEDEISSDFTNYLSTKFEPVSLDYKFRQKNKIYPNEESARNKSDYQGEHQFLVYKKKSVGT